MILSQQGVLSMRRIVGLGRVPARKHLQQQQQQSPKTLLLKMRTQQPCRRLLANTSSSTASTSKEESSPFSFSSSQKNTAVVALACVSLGFACGRWTMSSAPQEKEHHQHQQQHVLPSGLPRTCCDKNDTETTKSSKKQNNLSQLTDDQKKALHGKLCKIMGKENVLHGSSDEYTSRNRARTVPFLKGARLGHGSCLYICTPTRLQEAVDAVTAIVEANCVVLPQGQNTGLTGGSVPRTTTTTDDRPIVVLSMKHLNRMFPIDNGERMVCLAGVGLAQLQQYLDKEFPHRESHSTLGSTFLNPTTAAGVAFGSGGTQMRKGPAYTERALYLKIYENKWKEFVVEIVNTLGIDGMEDDLITSQMGRPRKMDSISNRVDTWSRWIQGGYERQMRYSSKKSPHGQAPASDVDYAHRLCQHTEHDANGDNSVSRYNADTRGPDPNRSEGKVIILATVHDTFPKPQQTKTYWISFDSLDTALKFRRQVCLSSPHDLPVSMEYMDRDSFDIIDRAGRFMAKTIQLTGTSSSIVQQLWKVKLWVEALPFESASLWGDYVFYYINPIIPSVLPSKVAEMGRTKDHHVALTMGDYGNGEMERFLQRLEKFVQEQNGGGGEEKIQLFECTKPSQTKGLTAFRFVAATAFRTWCVGNHMQGISVDYALPKTNGGSKPPLIVAKTNATNNIDDNDGDTQAVQPVKRMRYSHFGCNVVHEDLAYAPGVDVEAAKHAFKEAVEKLSAGKLPAEHGHGTEYHAPRETQERWQRMDPLNVLNPGIGGMSDKFKYKE